MMVRTMTLMQDISLITRYDPYDYEGFSGVWV
jgi:hypothetical protein